MKNKRNVKNQKERNFTVFKKEKKFESINFYSQIEKFHVPFFFNQDIF